MTNFALYNVEDGRVLQFMTTHESLIADQIQEPGVEFYLNCPGWATHIINNEPVKVEPTPPPPTEAEIIAALASAVQRHLDSTARTRNYDGILSLCSYATSLDPTFKAEGQAGVEWRDACWRRCYEVMADVKAGIQPVPTSEELIASLPIIAWPQ